MFASRPIQVAWLMCITASRLQFTEQSRGCICQCRAIATTIRIFRRYAISGLSPARNSISVLSILPMGSKAQSVGLRQRSVLYQISVSRLNADSDDGHQEP